MQRFPALFFLLSTVSSAQITLSLEDAVSQAIESHPRIVYAREAVEAARGGQKQASLSPNPRLILQTENLRGPGGTGFVVPRDTDNFAYLQQTFETASKRARRVDTAESAVRMAEAQLQLLRQQLAQRVAAAYWRAAGAEHLRMLVMEHTANLAKVVEFHEIRLRGGAIAEGDAIRVRLEHQRARSSEFRAGLDAQRGRIELLREMGRTEFPEVRFANPVEQAAESLEGLSADAALASRAERTAARITLEAARAEHRLQIANARPDVDALFGLKRTGGFNTLIAGLQVDLPLRNKNEGRIATASAEIRQAEANLAAAEALIRAEYEAAQAEYDYRRREADAVLRGLVAGAVESRRIADAAYREGGVDLLRLLDSQRLELEARTALARGLVDLRLSESALRAAAGALVKP